MQHDAAGQHIALGRFTLAAQAAAFVGQGAGSGQRVGPCTRHFASHAQTGHTQLAGVADKQQIRLQIVVADAGLVRIRQALQQLGGQAGGFQPGQATRRQMFTQGGSVTRVVGHIGPAVLHAAFHHRGQLRMFQARGLAHGLLPAFQRCGAGGLDTRQHQHQVLAAAWVCHAPGHGAFALAQQLQQLQAAEPAHGVGARRGGGRVCVGGGHGSLIEARPAAGRWSEQGLVRGALPG